MQIVGIDFTSAPRPGKPITAARCEFQNHELTLLELLAWRNFEMFEAFLAQPGHWIAAMDFPFSMPKSWLQAMSWPTDWADSVRHISRFSLREFCQCIKQYRLTQPAGKKHHFRPIDRLAGACSPMTIDYTPVGRMFYQGAPRLLKAGVCVLPFMQQQADSMHRLVVEGYPALIARRLAPKLAYKSDTASQQNEARAFARKSMVHGIKTGDLLDEFGFGIDLNGFETALVEDATGDRLDALLCAIQAGWAYSQAAQNYGLPATPKAKEGWIADPTFQLGANASF